MSNNLPIKSIRKNPISLDKKYALLTDELFGLVLLEIKSDKSVYYTIYNQLNFGSTKQVKSHHQKDGTFFYNNIERNLRTYIMLDEEKTELIDIKQDNLRMALRRGRK